MTTLQIKINDGTPSNGDLDLSDRGSTTAKRKYVIMWKVKNNSKVASVTSIVVKPTSRDIFSSLTPIDLEKTIWRGVIKDDAPYADCYYSIFWKDTNGGGPHEYDPKIAIKPPKFSLLKKVQGGFFLLLGALGLALLFWRREK